MKILQILILLSILSISNAFNITCNYRTIFLTLNDSYGCDGTDLTYGSSQITSITGNHQVGMSDSDVEVFRIWNDCGLEAVPQKITNYFPNLIALWLNGCQLREISKDDFVDYENLVELDLAENRMEFLHEKAFEGLRNLKFLYLNDNRMIFVGPNILQPLNDLIYVSFERNDCIDSKLLNFDETELRNYVIDIAIQCLLTVKIAEKFFEKIDSRKLKNFISDLREVMDNALMTYYDEDESEDEVDYTINSQEEQDILREFEAELRHLIAKNMQKSDINKIKLRNMQHENEKLKIRETILNFKKSEGKIVENEEMKNRNREIEDLKKIVQELKLENLEMKKIMREIKK